MVSNIVKMRLRTDAERRFPKKATKGQEQHQVRDRLLSHADHHKARGIFSVLLGNAQTARHLISNPLVQRVDMLGTE